VVGVASKIRDSDQHYLFFDVDSYDCNGFRGYILRRYVGKVPVMLSNTPNGVHCIVFRSGSFVDTAREILLAPSVDLTWFAMGLKRGYWFLRDRFPHPICMTYGLTPMKIEMVKKGAEA